MRSFNLIEETKYILVGLEKFWGFTKRLHKTHEMPSELSYSKNV